MDWREFPAALSQRRLTYSTACSYQVRSLTCPSSGPSFQNGHAPFDVERGAVPRGRDQLGPAAVGQRPGRECLVEFGTGYRPANRVRGPAAALVGPDLPGPERIGDGTAADRGWARFLAPGGQSTSCPLSQSSKS